MNAAEVLIVAPADEFPAVLPRSGRAAARLAEHPRVRLWSPPGMDHSMFASEVRADIERVVLAFLRDGMPGLDAARQGRPTVAASSEGLTGANHSALTARS